MELADALNRNLIFVKDLQAKKNIQTITELDLHDGLTRELLMQCREPEANAVSKIAKFIGGKTAKIGPFNIQATLPESGVQAFRIVREVAAFRIKNIHCFDQQDDLIGELRPMVLSLGKKYKVVDSSGSKQHVLQIKDGLKTHKIHVDKQHVATVQFGWKGENRDYFKSGFSQVIQFTKATSDDLKIRQLILGVASCIKIMR